MKHFRIFQVVPDSGTIPSSKKSSIWKNNLHFPLISMGHDVVLLDYRYDEFFVHAENAAWLKKHSSSFSEALLKKFNDEHKKSPFDFCFLYLCDGFVDEGVIKQIQSHGVPVLNYSCNNIHQFHLVRGISKSVDCSIYAELHAKEKFAEIGVTSVQMQMAANPDFYKPLKKKYLYDASFVGQRYADRGSLMAKLISNGINAHAFGPRWINDGEKVGTVSIGDRLNKLLTISEKDGWMYTFNFLFNKVKKVKSSGDEDIVLKNHAGGILSDDEMLEVFSQTKINLGFATVYNGGREGGRELYHLRLRDFEIPMCGGFYLTRYTDELEEYFEVGKEIECYSDEDELVDKCRYYLSNDIKRENIRQAALTRSLKDHTWKNRFNKLFSDPTIKNLISK